MKHEAFLRERDALLRARPTLLDCGELNVYRSLAPHFAPIAPSTHEQAPYRCHLAEQFLTRLGLGHELEARTQVSHGVRRSLSALATLLATRGARVGLPADVYPVYLELFAAAGADVRPFPAQHGLPALDGLDALLLCEPLKPWGSSLTERDAEHLTAWVRAEPERMVIIDSAYATPPSALTLRLLHDDVAVVLCSLSKGWLIPDHGGLCIVPTRWQQEARALFAPLPRDEQKLRIAFAALTEHPHREREVAAHLQRRATALDALTSARPELGASRCVGYFATSARSFETLLELGVLSVPASVFGGPPHLSILSSLERSERR